MNNNTETNVTQPGLLSFDPIVLVLDVVKQWLLIIAVTVVACVGAYIFTSLDYEPVYKTTTTFVVTTRSSSGNVYNNLSSTSDVASVFSELLNSSVMRKYILEDIGTAGFSGMISASAVPETNLLSVQVSAADPRSAYMVARAIIDNHESLTYQIIDGVSIEVLMHPSVPTYPSNSAGAMDAMKKAGFFAAVATVGLILLMSLGQDKVRSAQEARAKLSCRYLGEIPHEKKHRTLSSWLRRKKTSILISNPLTSFRFVETFRKLRHRVEQRMGSGKVLMVTSVLENEGKSTVSVNLCVSMAKKKGKVLLIDCDLRKPACHNLLEFKKFTHTVADVISGKAKPEDAVVFDKKNNMYLLLERQGYPHSGDLLSSRAMTELLDWARANFDFIVLDLPPMAEVSDAERMNKYADASLLVIRQNRAHTAVINKMVSVLDNGDAKLLGCVLNNTYVSALNSSTGMAYGGYGKYGKYGNYGNYHTKTKTRN